MIYMLLYHSLYICDIVLVISFVTFRHLINDMKMEICIFFTPNKNKRSCCGLTHTLFMAGSQSSSTYILVLYLYRQILVAYKWHFIVNKMIYVTEVCSNQFIRYMIALQSPYMIALQSPLSLHNWSRDRWQFIDVQRSRFLELKVNNSFILSIRLISLKGYCLPAA